MESKKQTVEERTKQLHLDLQQIKQQNEEKATMLIEFEKTHREDELKKKSELV